MSTREGSVRAADEDEPSGNGSTGGATQSVAEALRDARREARQRQRVEHMRSAEAPAAPEEAPAAPERLAAAPERSPAAPERPPAAAVRTEVHLVDRQEPSVRQVRGVLRQVDLWSVFRCALLLYGSMLVVAMVAFVVLWVAASATGARHSVEHFIASALLLKQFHFASVTILLSTTAIGAVLVAMATGATVMLAAFYNLISDVVGGVEVTVLQEEPADPVV